MGISGQRHTPAAHCHRAAWASELVWTQTLEEKSFASAEDLTENIQSGLCYNQMWLATKAHVQYYEQG
jgi:hypothetical protein